LRGEENLYEASTTSNGVRRRARELLVGTRAFSSSNQFEDHLNLRSRGWAPDVAFCPAATNAEDRLPSSVNVRCFRLENYAAVQERRDGTDTTGWPR